MLRNATFALQAIATVATLGVSAFTAAHAQADPAVVGAAFALAALGILQGAAGLLVARNGAGEETREAALDGILDHTVGAIRRLLAAHGDYRESLSGFEASLSPRASRDQVQEVIHNLLSRNEEMQARVDDLSRNLEESQAQIVNLRNNVSEVGKIAMTDALTELGNRRFFDQTLASEMASAKAGRTPLCLAIADLDRFKSVNDRYGHTVGDRLLRVFADLLAAHMKGRGFAARYGGEEFTLLFPGADIGSATARVERIRRELEAKNWVAGPKSERLGAVTASFGVAELDARDSAKSFVERADRLLFEAKQRGRNRVASEDGASRASTSTSLAS